MIKLPDLEKERSERKLTPEEFLSSYNADLPSSFPRATHGLLSEFKSAHPSFFKGKSTWSLGEHRKKLMDWLPQRMKEDARTK